jgi:hypothetical protein
MKCNKRILLAAACAVPVSMAFAGNNNDNDEVLSRFSFGSQAVLAGQSARLNVVNVTRPMSGHAAPCKVELRFVGDDGKTLLDSDSVPVVQKVTLAPGSSTSLVLQAPPGSGATHRVAARPVVRKFTSSCRLLPSAELLNNATGAMTAAWPAQPCYMTNRFVTITPFGLHSVTIGQTVRFGVSNTPSDPVTPGDPIRVLLSFVDAAGQTVVVNGVPLVSDVVIAPGATATLSAPVSNVTGALLRPTVRVVQQPGPARPARCAVLASAEVFDSATGLTTVMQPGDPIIPAL